MFSSVDPRATSWARRVFSAEVNSGIIVAPMPSPITNSIGMITPYGVDAVTWVSPNMPMTIRVRPTGTIRPTGILSTSAPGDRHRDHRAEPLRGDQQAGVQGRLAADLLEVGRHQEQPAEERRREQEHRDDRDREVAVAEQPQVQQRVLGPERVPARRQPIRSAPDEHRHPDPRRREVTVLLRGARRPRTGTGPGRETSGPCPGSRSDSDGSGESLAQRRSRRRPGRSAPIGTLIRKIQCQLAVSISQPPRIGPRIGPEQHRHPEDGHQPAHPVRTGRPGHDRHAERHQHAAAEALQHPERRSAC